MGQGWAAPEAFSERSREMLAEYPALFLLSDFRAEYLASFLFFSELAIQDLMKFAKNPAEFMKYGRKIQNMIPLMNLSR